MITNASALTHFAVQTGHNATIPPKKSKNPWIPENAWNPGVLSLLAQARMTKKETAFRLSRMVREGGVEPPRPE